MKNRMLTFVAVLIGLSTALITQSYTPVEANRWGVNGSTLVDLSLKTRNDGPNPPANTYRCDIEENTICSGTYIGTPSEPEDLTETDEGVFSLNE